MVCEVSGTPSPTAQWFKGETTLIENDRIKILSANNKHTLRIENIKEETDNGLYRVQFKNDFGTSESKNNVTVLSKLKIKFLLDINELNLKIFFIFKKVPPTFVKKLPEKFSANLAKTSVLEVQILSKPLSKIRWLKDNKELAIKDRFKVETANLEGETNQNIKVYRLLIENVQANDFGLYKIEASNKCSTETNQTEVNVQGEPVFVRKPSDLSVVEKKPAKIECEVIGLPVPTIEWYKDGKLVEKSDNIQIEVKNKVINVLTIKSVSPQNFGTYTIKARNEIGEAECSVILNVDQAPYFITQLSDKFLVNENETARIECEIGGLPEPTISWVRKGEDIHVEEGSKKFEKLKENHKCVLLIHNPKMEDSGVYNIVAANKVGKITAKTELVVQIAPRFIRKISDTQVIEKRVTKLEAEILAVPKPKVFWYKNGDEIVNDERVQSHDAKGGVYQLSIKNSRKDDTGNYKCLAVNEIGKAECSAQLVIEMAPQFLKKLEKLDAVESCSAEWVFQLAGIPKPSIEFALNNNFLDLEAYKEFYTLEEQEDHYYVLKFKTVRKKDVGNWTCSASNSAGKASCIARLETLPLSPPKFLKELDETIRLPQETDNRIEVKVTGIPFPQIEWFKDGEKLDLIDNSKYKTDRDMITGTLTLIILNCQKGADSGKYKARIWNQGGECSSEGNVIVKGYPPKFIEKPEKVYAIANDVAIFAAVVDADPKPEVTWTKGRTQLSENADVKIYYDEKIDVYFMEIANCKSKDAGTYQVTATNEFGSDTAPVTLIITQNPDEVVDLKSKLKNREVKKRSSQEEGPEWGKLRKASANKRGDDNDQEQIKLRHVELPKKQAEEEVKKAPEEVILNIFNVKGINKLNKFF